MQLLIFTGLILLGGLLNFIMELKPGTINALAKGYVILAVLLSLNVWVFYFAGIKNTMALGSLSFLMEWGGMLGHLVLGYLTGSVLMVLSSENLTAGFPVKALIRLTLWGISILTGNSFILATVGKAAHLAEMIAFFTASGYTVWFLYFIMAAEVLGGFGVLLHFRLRTGPSAAAGLMLIMFGAVYTHWHNKDPFSDSYAAVGQLVNLALMLVLYYLEKRAASRLPATSIYVV